MAYAVAPGWIILICMLVAGFCVCVGYAIARLLLSKEEEEPQRSTDQDKYMREVRARRMMYLEEICYGPRNKRVYGHGANVKRVSLGTLIGLVAYPIIPKDRMKSDLGASIAAGNIAGKRYTYRLSTRSSGHSYLHRTIPIEHNNHTEKGLCIRRPMWVQTVGRDSMRPCIWVIIKGKIVLQDHVLIMALGALAQHSAIQWARMPSPWITPIAFRPLAASGDPFVLSYMKAWGDDVSVYPVESNVAFGDVLEELHEFVVSRVASVIVQTEHNVIDVVVYGHPVPIVD
ncbi:uncharacterized protein BDZ99DRAFT_573165 [Mytilinidion resinicola]|uniref:Uncharacterized protein n=1 Tax=Mytilinidion resinicola TaxID=574789 RepID=A0A6A6YEP8_9PEZI|nr:uncharacterized protein BDZ99DRAFT_573165 [Mytilinidion resinicola]KAF2807306.1 hypothetical protein BDZ99DRAFT_573165 [Mytilinidion resinicola]